LNILIGYGKRIKEARGKLTQEELANKVGVKTTYISDIETERKNPSGRLIRLISIISNFNENWLLRGEGPKYIHKKETSLSPDQVRIPLYSYVPASPPEELEEIKEGEITLPKNILPPGEYWAIRVSGDSMINAHILDGTIVIIRQTPEVNSGSIALVRIGNEITLKRIYIFPKRVILRSENPGYNDLEISLGEYRGVEVLGEALLGILSFSSGAKMVKLK